MANDVGLLCRLPKSLVKERKQEMWAGRPRYGQSAVYVVTLDIGSLRSRGLDLEQAVSCKMVSSECQCGPPLLLSMTSRMQRAQLQLQPKIFNALGVAEVAICLVVMDHSVMSKDSWRLVGYMLVGVRQKKGGPETFLASAAQLIAELTSWEDRLAMEAPPSPASELVREAKGEMLRLITEQLSKPGSSQSLAFFKGELQKASGSKV
ncbi:unnamed protein product, partial [Symbiodinium pilosum]